MSTSANIQSLTDGPISVAVGFVNQETRIGKIHAFDPASGIISLVYNPPGPDQLKTAFTTDLKVSDIAFMGFKRSRASSGRPPREELREYDIHLVGKRKLNVYASAETITDPHGFFAWPLSENLVYYEYFFFAHAIVGREDKEPLGALMVKNGIVDEKDINAALDQQTDNQNTPIGQILVEHQVLKSEEVAEAAARQREQAKQGRPMRLGEILTEAGLTTDDQIMHALKEQKKRKGKRLGEVLIELGIVTEENVAKTLAKKFHLPFVNLDEVELSPEAVAELPANMIEKYKVFPFQGTESKILVAISDPLAMEPLDMLRFSQSKQIEEYMVMPSQLDKYIHTYLSGSASQVAELQMDDILAELGGDDDDLSEKSTDFHEAQKEDPAVTKLVNRIIVDAYRQGASDIHIEPYGKSSDIVVRFRIDGVCEVYQKIPAVNRARIVARIKIMAELDIAERRKPQDGKIRFRIAKRLVELRVATIPTVNGNEDVVLRILAGAGAMPLKEMQFSAANLENIDQLVKRPYGLVLCVGPTGSGKTTTLHAMVGHINDHSRKIWTAEDPVEITQYGLRQVQVKPQIDFTFAAAMRAFLRADPDVILVGEMRDLETASIGIEASLTGHLVLSTLHTNSAAETITRLIDMGLDPFNFGDALLGVLAQRLARRLCTKCKAPHAASPAELEEIASYLGSERLEAKMENGALQLWHAPGCEACSDKGYKGRVGIHELLVANDELRTAIQKKKPVDELITIARTNGMQTLMQDGLEKSITGDTDLRQVLSVCNR